MTLVNKNYQKRRRRSSSQHGITSRQV